MGDTMSICGIKYFLTHLKDPDIRAVVEYSLELATAHIDQINVMMNVENYPKPMGFTEHDVNLQAPPLFSETLILMYISHMAKFGLASYSMALATSARKDVMEFYSECLKTTTELNNKTMEIGLEKGVYVRSPMIPVPEKISFIHGETLIGSLFGDQRPLFGPEISNIFYNLKRNALGKALIIAFGQVAESDEVQAYFKRGKELSQKQIDIFSRLLLDDDLPAPMLWDAEISDSTIPPFSDKLMMFHISTLIASGIGQYGISQAVSPRKDVAAAYLRLSAELAVYAADGAAIMIKNGWMEAPPQAIDRRKLVKS
jgi:spore coat protein CotF